MSYQVRLADRELVHQLSAHLVHEKKYNALRQHKGVPGKCLICFFCTYIYVCVGVCLHLYPHRCMEVCDFQEDELLAQTVSL